MNPEKRAIDCEGFTLAENPTDPTPIATPNDSRPLRISERLSLILGARLDIAMERLRHAKTEVRLVNPCVAKIILVTLGDFHGADGRIFPALNTIAAVACASRATVIRSLRVLERLDLIKIDRRFSLKKNPNHWRTNWYTLNWSAIRCLNEQVSDGNLVKLPSATSAHIPGQLHQVAGGNGSKLPMATQTGHHQPRESTGPLQSDEPKGSMISFDDERPVAGASSDQIKAALVQAGMGRGRAHNLANSRWLTVIDYRNALAKARHYRPENPGAYIGDLLDAAIEQAKSERARRNAEAAKQLQIEVDQADAAIAGMTDEDISAICDGASFAGLGPEAIRSDPVFRREAAMRLVKSQRSAAK